MENGRWISAVLLLMYAAYRNVDCQECLRDAACDSLSNKVTVNTTTVCCDTDKVPHPGQSSQGSVTCTCLASASEPLDQKIQAWARATDGQGRICQHGELSCSGSKSNTTISNGIKFCCRKQPSYDYITIFNSGNIEYIGCRCINDPIPINPDPNAYVVPHTGLYNSSGENCGYNALCDDHPRLKCESPQATYCCYGSRGMKLANAGTLTQCTCTHEFHGQQCVSDLKPIPDFVNQEDTTVVVTAEKDDHDGDDRTVKTPAKIACQRECRDKLDSEKCQGENDDERCCPDQMTISATRLKGGKFTACTCVTTLQQKMCRIVDNVNDASAAQRTRSAAFGFLVAAVVAFAV